MASPWSLGSLVPLSHHPPLTAPSAPQGPAVPPEWQQPPPARQIPQQPPLTYYQPRRTYLSATQPHTFDDPAQPQAPAPNQVAPQLSDPSSFHGPGHIEYDDPPTVPEILPTANDLISALLTIPTFLYYLLFLFLPFFYHARVNQIYSGVSLTEHEIASRYVGGPPTGFWRPKYWEEVKRSWADFIDSSIKEWNTLNIVSVLLLGAIYNVFQLGGAGSPLVQCTAIMSLISALMSLIFGCLYVIRFETMRRPHKAMQWAKDALANRSPWWNVFILLALPFIWLAWSLILFLICLMAVVWQTSGHTTALRGLDPLSLQVKIIISVFFAIGVFYLFLILTTFRHYGDLDEVWQKRFRQMVETAATASRQYDQAYSWGAAPYPMTAEQPPGPPGMSFAPIIPNVGPPIQPVIPPPPIIPGDPYHIPSAQSMGIPQQQLAQYTMASRSGTPASVRLSPIDITTPFIPSLHIASQSPTASYRTQPYDNRYLSPNADTLYSIAEGEGQEPSSPAFRRSRVQSQPQRQYSNDTRSSTDSQDFTRRPPAPSPSPGVRPMPMAFPPDTTNTNTTNTTNMAITIEQPSSVSDSLDILERDEMPRQRQYQHQRQHQHQHQQHHAWPGPDTGQFDDKQSVATTPVPPYIDITPSLGFGVGTSIGSAAGGANATATPGGGLGVGVDLGGNGSGSGGGGSRRSSRRPTPSPHRTDRTTDRLDRLDRPQDRNLRASDRLRPPDLPLGAAPEIMTRSISLPVALERSYDNTGPPLSSSAAATAITEPPPQAQPLDAPITDQPHPPPTQSQTQTPHSPLLSSIPLPPHVSPLPDVPNILTDDASAGIGVAAGASAGATGAGGITNLARPPPRPEDDAASMSSLELYSITPRPRGGSGNGDARSSMTMSEGVSLYSARAHFDSRSGSDE